MPHVFNEMEIEKKIKEDQIKRLIPEGIRKLTVISSEQRDSEYGGYFMLGVKDKDANKESVIFVSLSPKSHKIFKRSCECFEIMDKYELGTVDSNDYLGKVGYCKIVHEDRGGDRGVQAKVEEYLPPETNPESDEDLNEDIPF